MRVFVITEDFRKDQFILQPIVQALLKEIGKPKANVRVTHELLGGVDAALEWGKIKTIVSRYRGMVDLFLLCVDRDGNENRRSALDELERRAAVLLPAGKGFFGVEAWEELETWVLAGIDSLPATWNWQDVRAEIDVKERYFEPLAKERRLLDEPGEGRKTLAQEAARRFDRIRQLCSDDIGRLVNRLREWLNKTP